MGEEIARHSCEVVYGGTNCGLMREVAQAALRAGGKVKGIIPACIQEKGITATGLTELVITSDMKERKQKMRETADAFLAMPGGWGTLEEITEVITLKQLGIHNKPVIFLNIEGFYDSFFSFIQDVYKRQTVLFAGDILGSNAYKPLVSFSIRSNSGAETSLAKELWWNYFRSVTHK